MIQDKQDGLKPDETAEMNHVFRRIQTITGGGWKGRKAGKSPEHIVA